MSTSIIEQLTRIGLPENIVNNKRLFRLERMMITQRDLVEELR